MTKSFFRWSAIALACSIAGVAAAQSTAYPSKPVRVVIPWPPGGGNDIAGRIVMQKVSESTGSNSPSTIGAALEERLVRPRRQVAARGYTIMVHSITHVGNAHLYKDLPYEALKDFAPVGLLTGQMAVLTVHPSLPAKSVKEFIAFAKARPDEILYSTAGNGSIPHLLWRCSLR